MEFIFFFGVLSFGEVVQTVKKALEAGFEKVKFEPQSKYQDVGGRGILSNPGGKLVDFGEKVQKKRLQLFRFVQGFRNVAGPAHLQEPPPVGHMLSFIPGHLLPEGAQFRIPGSGGQFPIKGESPVLNAEAQLEDSRQPALFGHGVLLLELTKMETTFFINYKENPGSCQTL
jgi:hypothetical protein